MFKEPIYDGSGKIYENIESSFPIYYFHKKEYILNNKHQLTENKPDYYTSDDKYTFTAEKSINLYKKDKTTRFGTIKRGETVTFLGGDDLQWMVIQKSNGMTAWVKIPQSDEVSDYFDTRTGKYSLQADLDGDGKDDKIAFEFYGKTSLLKVIINGENISYNDFWLGAFEDALPVGDLLANQIQTVDLNKKDRYKEILITIPPQFGIDKNVLLYYDKSPKKMGTFNNLSFDGDGEIVERSLSTFPGNYFYNKKFELNSKHQLEEIKPEYYKISEDFKLTATKSIDLFNKDKVTVMGIIEKGEIVKFLGGDDQQWMVIEKSDGTVGWVRAPDKGSIMDYFNELESMLIVF